MAVRRKKKKSATQPRPYCAAVVPAAGQAVRMQGQDKIFYELDGVPLIIQTLMALNACPDIDEIVVAARADDVIPLSEQCRLYNIAKLSHIVCGGKTRVHSVLSGLMAISPEAELAAIHDGARPLVTSSIISDVVRLAAQCGAAAPAVPLKDTVKQVENGRVLSTIARDSLMLIQTPQVFNAGLIKGALTMALQENWDVSDDCGAVERMGMSVLLSEGSYENLKVTTPEDLLVAEALLRRAGGRA